LSSVSSALLDAVRSSSPKANERERPTSKGKEMQPNGNGALESAESAKAKPSRRLSLGKVFGKEPEETRERKVQGAGWKEFKKGI
jgi:hypothetical protein